MRRGRLSDPIGQQRETVDGKVLARLGMQVGGEVGRGYWELLGRSIELDDTSWGDVG